MHDIMNSLCLKANISDVSRTIADVQTNMDFKLSQDDLMKNLEDFVSK